MKFIHLSDLHFSPDTDGRLSRKLRKNLIDYLNNLKLCVDELLITGDFRHARLQKNMDQQSIIDMVIDYIWKIASSVGIKSSEHIHIVPGNHDRSRPRSMKRMDQIRKNYSIDSGNFEAADLKYLRQQFSFFDKLCASLYDTDCIWNSAELHTYRVQSSTVFLYMNTAIMHNSDDDRGRLIIGNDYLDRTLEEIEQKFPGFPVIALAHHSPDFFEKHEKEAVGMIFRDHPVDLYLCGDAHEVWWRETDGRFEITMGCIKQDKGTQAAFLYGDTELREYKAYHWVDAWEPYTYFNSELLKRLPSAPTELDPELLRRDQESLKNDVLLPWMRNSPSIKALFPQLFVEPAYKSEKMRRKYDTYGDILAEHGNAHIIITGKAGAGKTTLLKQLYLYENPDCRFLYLNAGVLIAPSYRLSPYEQFVRGLVIDGAGDEKDYIVLLDAIDEAYANNSNGLNRLIQSINKLRNTHVWFGWRKEHLIRNETEALRRLTADTVFLDAWKPQMAQEYVVKYTTRTQQTHIIHSYTELIRDNSSIRGFTESPFQLALLVYLLENKDTDDTISRYFTQKSQTIYNLYEIFFQCWLRKEHDRKTSKMSGEEIRLALWDISSKLYVSPSCKIPFDDTAIMDLLSFSGFRNDHIANGFFHRSFCAFFLADRIFNAVKAGDRDVIDALKIPLRNDVKDFVRSAIRGSTESEIGQIQKNLIDTYRQAVNPREAILSKAAIARMQALGDEERFYLKNEVIYLVTRIRDYAGIIPGFLESIYYQDKDPYVFLDIAYAAALTDPRWIALEYAKSLEPGSENSLINRSWTLAYFGDVQANPHKYRDTEKVPWEKARNARLKRFKETTQKARRFRILDFPLMYCFYVDREWKDANRTDYDIIAQADIESGAFSKEERIFLKMKKDQLLQGFQDHM